jgi:hypothetical protein
MLLKQERMGAYGFEGKRHDSGDKLGFLKQSSLRSRDLIWATSFGNISLASRFETRIG